MKQHFSLVCALLCLSAALPGFADPAIDARVRETLAKMTLEEKASLCSGLDWWNTKPVDRLGVPSIWLADGPHGLRKAPSGAGIGLGTSHPATCFPTAAALACSWDRALLSEIGEALGREALAQQVSILLGPGVNIKRSPLGGRNFEYFSEDPLLTGELASALIRGIQRHGVGTSLKHYVCNNQEFERMTMSSEVDERTLREIYLRGFEIAVKQARPWTVMASYNLVNGVYVTESRRLLHDILKTEWGFEGVVVSDWGAVSRRVDALQAGLHLEMPATGGYTDSQIVEAVRNHRLDEALLDEIASELLAIIFRATENRRPDASFDEAAHHDLARRAASESAVLLKNDGAVLPLTAGRAAKVAIIGRFAKEPRYQGAGSSQVVPTRVETAWNRLQHTAPQGLEFTYADGYGVSDTPDEALLAAARREAQSADVAVVFVGLPSSYESEGSDRADISLPPAHNALVNAVADVQPELVVVLSNGSAVGMPWVERVPAILEGWLTGQAGGAVADVLLGGVNPSGKLAVTFPVKSVDNPSHLNFPGESGKVRYGEGVFVGYRYYDAKEVEPLYAFGHGLSYTSFEYGDLELDKTTLNSSASLTASLTVRNTGGRPGKEVVQLYVSDPESSLPRPPKELKAFEKVALGPGEAKRVTFELAKSAFSYYDPKVGDWVAESGEFELLVGASSRDIRLRSTVNLQAERPRPVFSRYTPLKVWMSWPDTAEKLQPVMTALMAALSGAESPTSGNPEQPPEMGPMLADLPVVKLVNFTQGQFSLAALDQIIMEANSER
jgi:beta-glucosidase